MNRFITTSKSFKQWEPSVWGRFLPKPSVRFLSLLPSSFFYNYLNQALNHTAKRESNNYHTMTYSSNRSNFPTSSNGFPNYFYTQQPQQMQTLIELAMASILKRMNVQYIDPVDGSVKTENFFAKIEEIVLQTDPGAKVFNYGGVVRSLLGYLYQEVYKAHQEHCSPLTTEETLKKIATKTRDENGEGEISKLEALGIGSDLDILIEFSPDFPNEKKGSVLAQVTQFINERGQGMEDSFIKRTLVSVADVQEYAPQVNRAVSQGGSPIDCLAFPLSPKSGSGFRMPDHHPQIISDFLNGKVNYMPRGEDAPDSQTAREVRLFIEIPFLEPSDSCREQFSQELRQLQKKIETKTLTDKRVKKQFEKAVYNCRFPAACNCFAVPGPHDTDISQRIRTISLLLSEGNRPAIPEFLPEIPIKNRQDDFDPGALKKHGFLIPYDTFIQAWTDQGLLYHGTRGLEQLLSIMRTGPLVSTNQKNRPQGFAAYGRGFYTTAKRDLAQTHASETDTLLTFSLNPSRKLRVISLDTLPKRVILSMQKVAEQKRLDFHEWLTKEMSVDIIIHTFVLIQNADALIVPKTMQNMKKTIQDSITEIVHQIQNGVIDESLVTKLRSNLAYLNQKWVEFLFIPATAIKQQIREAILSLLQNPAASQRESGIRLVKKIYDLILDQGCRELLRPTDIQMFLQHQDVKMKFIGLQLLEREITREAPVYQDWGNLSIDCLHTLSELLEHEDEKILQIAMEWVSTLRTKTQKIYRKLLNIATNTSFKKATRHKALKVLVEFYPFYPIGPEMAQALFQEIYNQTTHAQDSLNFLSRLVKEPAVMAILQSAINSEKDPEYLHAVDILMDFNNASTFSQIEQFTRTIGFSTLETLLSSIKDCDGGPIASALHHFLSQLPYRPNGRELCVVALRALVTMIRNGDLRPSNAQVFVERFIDLLFQSQAPLELKQNALNISAKEAKAWDYLQKTLSENGIAKH